MLNLLTTTTPTRYQLDRLEHPYRDGDHGPVQVGRYQHLIDLRDTIDARSIFLATDTETGDQWRCCRWGKRVVMTPVNYHQRTAEAVDAWLRAQGH